MKWIIQKLFPSTVKQWDEPPNRSRGELLVFMILMGFASQVFGLLNGILYGLTL